MKIKIPKPYTASQKDIKDIIAPAGIEANPSYLKIGEKFVKTLFLFTYPKFLSSGWFSAIINLAEVFDIAIHIHPVDTAFALKQLRKKTAQIQAQLSEKQEKGFVRDPQLETAFQDIENLRDALQQAREKLFNTGLYIALYGDNLEDLKNLENLVLSLMEAKLVYLKPAIFQQIDGFSSVLPLGLDKLSIHTPLNTSPLSSLYPFTSPNLFSEKGILYGVNLANNSLIIFDRFSLQNANMVCFGASGSGKSFASKLEVLRSLMFGTDVLIIDPENEYQTLAETIGGSFFKISLTSEHNINPFDIPIIPEDEEPKEVLRSHILNLTGLIKLMLKEVTPEEDAFLDKAVRETYASRDIVPEKDFSSLQPPLLEDLLTVLENTEGGQGLAKRLEKFTRGSYAGFTNQATNVNIKNRLVVFSVRDLEEELRPIAMYIILNFIWNLIRSKLKKRIMLVDEAWWLMKYPDSASFLSGLVKRARKYYLGVTTITQNAEDLLNSPFGKPLVDNSSFQFLLRQSPAAIDVLAKAFNLTDTEKTFLLETGLGEGLFFAGLKHAAIKVVASNQEEQIVTTNPEELLDR